MSKTVRMVEMKDGNAEIAKPDRENLKTKENMNLYSEEQAGERYEMWSRLAQELPEGVNPKNIEEVER